MARLSNVPILEDTRLRMSEETHERYWTGRRETDADIEPMRVFIDVSRREVVRRHFLINKFSGECIESVEMRFDPQGRLATENPITAIEPRFRFNPDYFRPKDVEASMKKFLSHEDVHAWLDATLFPSKRGRRY